MFQMLHTMGSLVEFFEVYDSLKIPGDTAKAWRMRLFPFSLRDNAQIWLNSMQLGSITSWKELADKFLMK